MNEEQKFTNENFDSEEILTPSDFLTLMKLEDPCLIKGNRGVLYLSNDTVGFKLQNSEDWTVLLGEKSDIFLEKISIFDAIDLNEDLIDTTHNIEVGEGALSFIPNQNGKELSIIIGENKNACGWIHADKNLFEILELREKGIQQ